MIQANELRIGNWVKVGETISTVCLIDHNQFIQLSGNAIVNRPEQIEPIPLTPEILERCGFLGCTFNGSARNRLDAFRLGALMVKIHNPIYNYPDTGTKISVKYHKNLTHIIYMHQLQNLYFSLTGTELNIKL